MAEIRTYLCEDAPKPLGNYSHIVEHSGLLYVCGMGPRHFRTNEVPGLSLDPNGNKLSYDIRMETEATLENLKKLLNQAGSDLSRVLEMNVFLTNMADFPAMNEVYARYFTDSAPVRTTLGVASLPGNISVEMKAIAAKT